MSDTLSFNDCVWKEEGIWKIDTFGLDKWLKNNSKKYNSLSEFSKQIGIKTSKLNYNGIMAGDYLWSGDKFKKNDEFDFYNNMIGEIITNKYNEKYIILDTYREKMNIRGYEWIFKIKSVKHGIYLNITECKYNSGNFFTKYSPTIYGVGYLDGYTNNDFNVAYKNWGAMLARCYNRQNKGYAAYGAKGVRVDNRWHSFKNYINDIQKLEGFDMERYVRGEIVIDKDIKQMNKDKNLISYSKDNCVFLDKEINDILKRSGLILFKAISPIGDVYLDYTQRGFAKGHNLQGRTINQVLKGDYKTHKGWKFELINRYDYSNPKFKYKSKRVIPSLVKKYLWGDEFE